MSAAQQTDAFIEKILQSTRGAFEMFGMYLGVRLGYYRALSENGPANSQQLAERTGTYERYAREWLEQQAICGVLEVDNENSDAKSRRYTLPQVKHLAGSTGTVLVVDERVGDAFSTSKNDVDWMMYGWSILHCLPVGMADKPSAETGTVMRPDTLRTYAREAGFKNVEILPIENYFFRFYRLVP